ncbi:serine/threonine-protein kinase [Streptomyces sp. CB03578]|uniref:serine/threonine-protein kinase n=1 Tax=Streptomyces sp. CB03578 TaxID=1718987 RepID=UPI00093DFDED|nr:serine/threonine-protein kinase [Streptomyces sp. CB03578]
MAARPTRAHGSLVERGALLNGRYRLDRPIGSGGTADVFCGVDQVLGREVAVKVFRADADTVTADRFCDEARVLARLSHRALVTVYDAGRHEQGAFMVTELIRGVTLRTRINAGPLGLVQTLRLGVEISSALDHVHAHGIVHHDVKPSNILLGEDGFPYLADFGLSRAARDHSHSAPDTLVGTLAYMAPEQFLGQGASTASDVYALGITLLEALTGHREYRGTPMEVGTAHLLRSPQIPDELPADLGWLLKAMTDQDPQARPDAASIHVRLRSAVDAQQNRAAVGGGPADASTRRSPVVVPALVRAAVRCVRPPGTSTRRRAPAHRRAAAAGLALAAAVGLCVLVTGGIPVGGKTPSNTPSRDQPRASQMAEAADPGGTEVTPSASVTPSAAPSLPAPSAPEMRRPSAPSLGSPGLPPSPPPITPAPRQPGTSHFVKAPRSAQPPNPNGGIKETKVKKGRKSKE